MTDNEHPEPGTGSRSGSDAGGPPGTGGWQPITQGGEYDAEATAFVQLPPEDTSEAPLAAPGHGFVPPPIITPLLPDPSVAGSWAQRPDDGQAGAGQHWPEPQHHDGGAGQQHNAYYDPYRQGYDSGATAHWDFSEATGQDAAPGRTPGSQAPAEHPAPGTPQDQQAATGQWQFPTVGEHQGAGGESADFAAALAASPWNGVTPPATLPGGARAPWATEPDPQQAPLHEQSAPVGGAEAVEHRPADMASPEPWEHPAPATHEQAAGGAQGIAEHAGEPAVPAVDAEALTGQEHLAEPVPEQHPATYAAGFAEAPAAGDVTPGQLPFPGQEQQPAGDDAETAVTGPSGEDPQVPVAGADGQDEGAERPEAPGQVPGQEQLPGLDGLAVPLAGSSANGAEHAPSSYVLRVNGTDRPVTDAWIGESLLYVLRERLGLAGAKDGCSQGECGACNVQVDGRLVASCLVPAATAAGSEVRTVEGLADEGGPSDVQRALAAHGAVQCGFCIPGMAMTIHDLLEGNHAPSELETRQALSGNLCRCSGYRGVLEAVNEVAEARAASAEAVAAASAANSADTSEARIPHQAPPGEGGAHLPYTHDGGMA